MRQAASRIDMTGRAGTIGPFRKGGQAMTLTPEQVRLAERLDAKVKRLGRSDDIALFMAMADDMPDFRRVMDAAGQDGMDELCRRLDGFYRYAKVLETIAAGIESGDIEVPD